MSVEEYLRSEPASAVKREYVRGRVRALAGTTARHNRLLVRIMARLAQVVEARGCRLYAADVRLRVAEALFYYPDAMVVCADDPDPPQMTKPCLVIEVLSPSTRSTDLAEKRVACTALSSLEAYLVFDAERPRVIGFYRMPAGFEERRWDGSGAVAAACAGTNLELEELYRGL